jgi:predicted 3-demethylubiquinone-9 3-methyltransferase (glyoxalase superfamily)
MRVEHVSKIAPCLWFDDQAEQAADFYVTAFSARRATAGDGGESKILGISRYGEAGPGPAGTVMTVDFLLEGQEFVALNGGPEFTFTPALSLIVNCETQDEVDGLWETLSQGGTQGECGWLEDKFGVSWQIVPTALGELLADPDAERAQRVMRAMLEMRKLDIAALERAAGAPSGRWSSVGSMGRPEAHRFRGGPVASTVRGAGCSAGTGATGRPARTAIVCRVSSRS